MKEYRKGEGPIVVRSIGNSVGTKPFSNTNRPGRGMKRMNRAARRAGFNNAKDMARFFAALDPRNYAGL